MSTKKQAGSTRNVGSSQPNYRGVKLYDGQGAQPGAVIVRQKGTRLLPGRNVGLGRDHTIFALKEGTVSFRGVRKRNFNGKVYNRRVVEVL